MYVVFFYITFQIDYTFKLLDGGKHKTKFLLMKSPLILIMIQEILFEVIINNLGKTKTTQDHFF